MNGILYIVATPIGNLKDITVRALETITEVDFVACEDTRVASKLLSHYSIKKPLLSYHQHSQIVRVEKIIEHLKSDKSIALITDAGTPGISDPGNKLVEEVLKNDITVVPIPGVSALTTLASVSGIDMQKFVFLGFPPHKKGRETYFKKVAEMAKSGLPVILYESPYRILKTLVSLKDFRVIVGRELTKYFEEVARGSAVEALEYFEKNPGKVKGEFVIIVYSPC